MNTNQNQTHYFQLVATNDGSKSVTFRANGHRMAAELKLALNEMLWSRAFLRVLTNQKFIRLRDYPANVESAALGVAVPDEVPIASIAFDRDVAANPDFRKGAEYAYQLACCWVEAANADELINNLNDLAANRLAANRKPKKAG